MAPEPEANGGGFSDGTDSGIVGGVVGDGRYRMTHRLGRGGMAEVLAAEDVRLGRTVAVKLLRSDLAEDPVSKARFTREAQSVAGLNHHAIVAVYDSGEDVVAKATVPYIVMELVEGRTIRDLLLNAEAPPPEQALIIVSGVLEALAYSHQHGIVHRDIKPANVIITHSGAVKVMDFGIARALHGAQSTMTQTGMVMGTPQYLSPEQALGKAVDHRSDLYATGCLLYELLALRPPFTGETPLSVVYQHVQDIPVPPSEVSDGVPPELDGLVMRSLAKDPDDRFQSAEEMRGLVQYSLQMLQVQGGHTGTWNTGPVVMNDSGRTAPMNIGGGTAAMGHPMHGDTSQGPILPPMNPDDGAYAAWAPQRRRARQDVALRPAGPGRDRRGCRVRRQRGQRREQQEDTDPPVHLGLPVRVGGLPGADGRGDGGDRGTGRLDGRPELAHQGADVDPVHRADRADGDADRAHVLAGHEHGHVRRQHQRGRGRRDDHRADRSRHGSGYSGRR